MKLSQLNSKRCGKKKSDQIWVERVFFWKNRFVQSFTCKLVKWRCVQACAPHPWGCISTPTLVLYIGTKVKAKATLLPDAVADPGFPWWGVNPREGANLLFGITFPKNCIKMKKKWTCAFLDPPLRLVHRESNLIFTDKDQRNNLLLLSLSLSVNEPFCTTERTFRNPLALRTKWYHGKWLLNDLDRNWVFIFGLSHDLRYESLVK